MITIISERRFNEPKLKKPKELKGVKPFMSYKWGGVTTCQAFIQENNIWINHHDWCSIALYGLDVKYKSHFVYSDGFEAPVLKGDAWIKISEAMDGKIINVIRRITEECLINSNSRFCVDDERMFIDVIVNARRTI